MLLRCDTWTVAASYLVAARGWSGSLPSSRRDHSEIQIQDGCLIPGSTIENDRSPLPGSELLIVSLAMCPPPAYARGYHDGTTSAPRLPTRRWPIDVTMNAQGSKLVFQDVLNYPRPWRSDQSSLHNIDLKQAMNEQQKESYQAPWGVSNGNRLARLRGVSRHPRDHQRRPVFGPRCRSNQSATLTMSAGS